MYVYFYLKETCLQNKLCCAPIKWVMPIKIKPELKQELICLVSHVLLFLCRKKLSNTWGHDSCSGIHPVPWSPVTTLTDFWAQARNIHQSGDKQTHQCSLCGDTVCLGGHDSHPAPMVCVCSGHDCELGGTPDLRAITLLQVISVNILSARICQSLIDQLAWKRQPFLHLIAPSSKACKGKLTQSVSLHRNCENIIIKLENKVWKVGKIVEGWNIVSLILCLHWHPRMKSSF